MPRFAGLPYDGIQDRATRQAFRRLAEVMGNMFLAGNAADRPVSARLGAFWLNLDGNNEVYWYAGATIGWLQLHSETGSGELSWQPDDANAVVFSNATRYLDTQPDFAWNGSALGVPGNAQVSGYLNIGSGSLASSAGQVGADRLCLNATAYLDGATAGEVRIAGDLRYSDTEFWVLANTADAADSSRALLAGGGAGSITRGAFLYATGNEYTADSKGMLYLAGGNPGTAGTWDGCVSVWSRGVELAKFKGVTGYSDSIIYAYCNVCLDQSGTELQLYGASTQTIPVLHFRETDTGDDWYLRHTGDDLEFREELASTTRLTIHKGGGVRVHNQLLLSGGATGAAPTPMLTLGSYYDNSGDASVSHIDLYGGIFGFGIASSTLVYVSSRYHKFYDSSDLANPVFVLDGDTRCGTCYGYLNMEANPVRWQGDTKRMIDLSSTVNAISCYGPLLFKCYDGVDYNTKMTLERINGDLTVQGTFYTSGGAYYYAGTTRGLALGTYAQLQYGGNDYLQIRSSRLLVYQSAWLLDIQPTFVGCYTAAAMDIGSSTKYFNEINYKLLVDRGCLGWFEEGVEAPDGQGGYEKVSDMEALRRVQPHPTLETVHGVPRLDYASLPRASYRPAPRAAERTPKGMLDADGKETDEAWQPGEKMGEDGAEMTSLFSVVLGALKQLDRDVEELARRAGWQRPA